MNYYIQGCAAKADKIKAAFERNGIDTSANSSYGISNLFYYSYNGEVAVTQNRSVINIIKTHPDYKELELHIEPKFKVGDDIKTGNTIETIAEVGHATRSYYCESGRTISFENQDLWHLAPKPHYDIVNFKPFDKVLVRDSNGLKWTADLFSYIDDGFVCTGGIPCRQCIPFNENTKHLLGTTDMCDEQYINW